MNKYSLLLLLFLALPTAFPAAGQTKQSGYVKTRGRLADDGRLLPGERLAGASVILKGGNSTVSGADGSFTLTLSGSTYILQNVRKQGYEICDPELLARQYTHSANPHILVLETPARLLEEKLAAERKIRRTLQRTLAEREEELESLRAQHRLTRDEYNAALQQLYAAQRNDEQLIGEMAARYSRIDYDQLDDYRRQLSLFIREGELRRADSLLNSRGSFADRAAELERLHEANEQEAARLAGERDALEKSRKYVAAQLEAFGEDCYARHEICLTRHRPDSAAYYLELRAATDTTNLLWQQEMTFFLERYFTDYRRVLDSCFRTLDQSVRQYGPSNLWTASCYNNIGQVYQLLGNYNRAMEYYVKAMEIWNVVCDGNHPHQAMGYNNIATVYAFQGRYDEALTYFRKALDVQPDEPGVHYPHEAPSYNSMGSVYARQKRFNEALEYYLKALTIRQETLGEWHPDVAMSLNNIGMVYLNIGRSDDAMECFELALTIQHALLGERHPDVALCYGNIGTGYLALRQYDKALEMYLKSLEIQKETLGERHPALAQTCKNIGYLYRTTGATRLSKEYYRQAEEIEMMQNSEK